MSCPTHSPAGDCGPSIAGSRSSWEVSRLVYSPINLAHRSLLAELLPIPELDLSRNCRVRAVTYLSLGSRPDDRAGVHSRCFLACLCCLPPLLFLHPRQNRRPLRHQLGSAGLMFELCERAAAGSGAGDGR